MVEVAELTATAFYFTDRRKNKLPVILLPESKPESFVRVISKPEAWAHCFFKPSLDIMLPASNLSVSGRKLYQFLGNA